MVACVIRLFLDQLVDRRAGQRDQLRAAHRGRVLDVGRRMADAVEEAVDLAVAQRRPVLVRLQLGGEREVRHLPAHRGEQLLHRGARARAGVADVEALALEVGELFTFASLRASTVKGSGCSAITARRSPSRRLSGTGLRPSLALNCTSDCATPNSISPDFSRLTLATDPPVDSTEQRRPCLARSRLTSRQIAPPAG